MSKLFNIYFFGDKKQSEKLFSNTKEIEIHDEKINLNIIEQPDISIISTEEKKANGILLFFNVSENDSFNKIKLTIEKLIDMDKYEMPLIVVGNNPNNQERKIKFEDVKNFLDKYGIKYHEINEEENLDKNIENILGDLGEQVLYQDIIENNNNITNDNNENIININDKKDNKLDEKDNINENKENNEKSDESHETKSKTINTNQKENKVNKKSSKKHIKTTKSSGTIINKPFKPKINLEQNDVKEKKTQAQIKREELVREKRLKREKEMQQWYKKKEKEGIELKKKKEKENKLKLFEKLKEDKEIQKNKIKEIKEEFSSQKKERYEKSKRERELEEKKFIIEKEKNKIQLEKKLKSEKAHIKNLLLEKEQNEKENIENKRAKIFSPSSNRCRSKKGLEFNLENNSEILNNTISEFNLKENNSIKSKKIKKDDNNNKFGTLKKNATTINFFKTKNLKLNKIDNKTNTTKRKKEKKEKEKEKEKEEEVKQEIEIEKDEKDEKEKEDIIKEELEKNYINNNNIYRCPFCLRIPIININKYESKINIECICQNYFYNNMFNYNNFIDSSLNHPLNENNISCYYCQKKLSEIKEENDITISFCNLCNFFICSKDVSFHNNYHDIINHKELKEKYKKILMNKNIIKKSKTLRARKNTENKLNTSTKSIKQKKRTNTPQKEKNEQNKKNLNKTEINNDKANDKIFEDKKIPLYMIDSCCLEHNKINKSYCYNCNKNLCIKCEEKHIGHNLINLNEIDIKRDDLIKMKQNLDNEITELKKINEYFFTLIEKIKKEFNNIYELKQKEIEIKQKLIHDYETIKYNFNSIKNVQNIIKSKNNNHSFDFSNNKNNILNEIESIFNYLNKDKITYNKKDILISSNEISDMLKLDANKIAISSYDGFLEIYNKNKKNNFEIILRKKFFENNNGINSLIQLKNGDLGLIGKEKIVIINLNLDNKACDIINEINIKNAIIDFVQDLRNNFLISYDTNQELKLYKNYKFTYKYENNNLNIDSIYKIEDNSFITSSIKENKINLLKLNFEKNAPKLISFPLIKEINIKKGKSSLIKLNDNFFVFIYENQKHFNNIEEKYEESKNNEEIKLENGLCLIEINTLNNYFKILQKIENYDNKRNYTNLVNYLDKQFLVCDDIGLVEVWGFDYIKKKIFVKNKVNLNLNDLFILKGIFFEETEDIIFQTDRNIIRLLK